MTLCGCPHPVQMQTAETELLTFVPGLLLPFCFSKWCCCLSLHCSDEKLGRHPQLVLLSHPPSSLPVPAPRLWLSPHFILAPVEASLAQWLITTRHPTTMDSKPVSPFSPQSPAAQSVTCRLFVEHKPGSRFKVLSPCVSG
jgi:hypothetical protein